MRRKLVLKPFVIPTIYTVFVIGLLTSLFFTIPTGGGLKEKITYVNGSILEEYVPVLSEKKDVVILKPFKDSDIKIGKNFYDYEAEAKMQENSIIYHEGTYMQNSGIDYIREKVFDVYSILDGEVVEVKKEELLGNTVTIRHSNDIISVYQGLSEVLVKAGDQVTAGFLIGKSGTSELNKELGNHLHFELSIKGQLVNPENFFGKKLSELE